jgi:hypothetical protein
MMPAETVLERLGARLVEISKGATGGAWVRCPACGEAGPAGHDWPVFHVEAHRLRVRRDPALFWAETACIHGHVALAPTMQDMTADDRLRKAASFAPGIAREHLGEAARFILDNGNLLLEAGVPRLSVTRYNSAGLPDWPVVYLIPVDFWQFLAGLYASGLAQDVGRIVRAMSAA